MADGGWRMAMVSQSSLSANHGSYNSLRLDLLAVVVEREMGMWKNEMNQGLKGIKNTEIARNYELSNFYVIDKYSFNLYGDFELLTFICGR